MTFCFFLLDMVDIRKIIQKKQTKQSVRRANRSTSFGHLKDSVDITAEARETLTEITVREGDRVTAGQILAVQDDTLARARHAHALAERDQAALERIDGVDLVVTRHRLHRRRLPCCPLPPTLRR